MLIKKVILVLITLFFVNTTFADSYQNEDKNTNFIVTPSIAYRYDVFKWSVPHPQFNKKLSELVWKNHIVEPRIKIEIAPQPNQFTFLGQAKYGYILKHPSKSWDYDWIYNSSRPSSKNLSSVRGNIIDLSGAVGYSVGLVKDSLLTFYFGYDYTDYRNKDYGVRQLSYGQNRLLNSFKELISKYYFKTLSPWVGLSVNAKLNDRWSIIPTIKLYSFKYVGRGYWLLRDDVKQDPSMKHNARGAGLGVDVDLLYKYSDNLDFKINLETKQFKMKKGEEQAFYNKNNYVGEKVVNRQLYDLSLMSSSISAGFKYKL
jgi:hypothetical protein